MKIARLTAAVLAASVTAGCSGGGSTHLTPATPVPQQSPSGAPVNANFKIVVPAAPANSALRRRQYVSAATQSVAIAVQGGAKLGTFDVSAASKLCTGAQDGSRTCTAGVQAPEGSDTFVVTAYDGQNGTGDALATGTMMQSISGSSAAMIAVSLTGVTASVGIHVQSTMLPSGTAASIPVIVQAFDASGNTIVGTYDRAIALADSDTSRHTSLSAATVNGSDAAVTLQYDGGHMSAPVSISASASGVAATAPVSVQSVPSIAAQYDLATIATQDGSGQTPMGSSGIVQGPDGNFWIAAASAGAIVKMTPSGQTTTYWPPTPYTFPQEEVVGKDGAVWFTERDGNNIGRITMSGTITEYPIPTADSNPLGICVGPDGNIWFAEQTTNNVGKIDAAGNITEYSLGAGAVPTDLTTGPDGNLWIDETGYNQPAAIAVMDTGGKILATHALSRSNPQPYGIITGPDGNLWFGEYTGGMLARMTPAGQVTEYTPPSSSPGIVSLAGSKGGDIWFAESGAGFAATGQLGYITPGSATIHEVYLNMPLHVRNITFASNGALWYSGFYYDDSNVGEVMP